MRLYDQRLKELETLYPHASGGVVTAAARILVAEELKRRAELAAQRSLRPAA